MLKSIDLQLGFRTDPKKYKDTIKKKTIVTASSSTQVNIK